MKLKKLSLISISSLIISLLAMAPINRNYNKQEPWMSKVKDDIKLIDMSIPGTHDSGATHSIFDVSGKCQELNIKQQLNVGTRFFDLRLQLVEDEFRIIHGPVDQRLKFKNVLEDLTEYIKENNSEFLIISLKQEDSSINNSRDFEEVLKEDLQEHSDVICFDTVLPETIKEARGKIYIISRHNLDFGYPAYYGWNDDTTFTLNDLYVQDNYCVDSLEEKQNDIISAIAIANDITNNKLVINFTSCYLDVPFPPTYAGTIGRQINPWFINYVNEHSEDKLGIIVADFMSQELAESIYRRNY